MSNLSANLSSNRLAALVRLCRHRGFVFPSSALYGGLTGAYDYGPLGLQMKRKVESRWWRDFVERRPECVGVDTNVLLHPDVWRRAGHLDAFSDPLSECGECKALHRTDHIQDGKCPACGSRALLESRPFNLLFGTTVGIDTHTFLRPETAQGAYINFEHVAQATRRRLPLGIGQVGRAFRNEISPGHFLFRGREFQQMELQYFCRPEESAAVHAEWVDRCHVWLTRTLGLREASVRRVAHGAADLAHYALATTDIEYQYPFGWGELWGVSNRGAYDLGQHGISFRDRDEEEPLVPHVVEPAVGLDRLMFALLNDALTEHKKPKRTVLQLSPAVAPFDVAVLPLTSALVSRAEDVYAQLSEAVPAGSVVDFDRSGSIGRRYRRQDEIGTPFCVTIDPDTTTEGTVTIRDRDTMEQVRVRADDELVPALRELAAQKQEIAKET